MPKQFKEISLAIVVGFLMMAINSLVFLIIFISSFSYIFDALGDFYSFMKFKDDGTGFSLEEALIGE